MSKQSLEFSATANAEVAAEYLEAIAKGLRAGHLSLSRGAEEIELEVTPEMTLEIEAIARENRSSLELKLDWRLAKRPIDVSPALVIQSGPSFMPGWDEKDQVDEGDV